MTIPLPASPWDRPAASTRPPTAIRRIGLKLQRPPMSAAALSHVPVRSKIASASVRRTTLHLHRSRHAQAS
jgi:hypothetical protein